MALDLWWSLVAATQTDAPATNAADSPILWWVGGVIVTVFFGAIVVRTLRRNRLRK